MKSRTASPPITRAEAVPPAPSPEAALIGCLLQASAAYAAELLTLLEAEDLADPKFRIILELIRGLAVQDVDPTPAAVLAQAQLTAQVTTDEQTGRLGRLLMQAYTASSPPPAGAFFRRAVLGDALNRSLTATAARLDQIARAYPPGRYRAALSRSLVHFDDLWKRWIAAGGEEEDEVHPV